MRPLATEKDLLDDESCPFGHLTSLAMSPSPQGFLLASVLYRTPDV
jgi:hypothetical protein